MGETEQPIHDELTEEELWSPHREGPNAVNGPIKKFADEQAEQARKRYGLSEGEQVEDEELPKAA